jgi:hypothetical protein
VCDPFFVLVLLSKYFIFYFDTHSDNRFTILEKSYCKIFICTSNVIVLNKNIISFFENDNIFIKKFIFMYSFEISNCMYSLNLKKKEILCYMIPIPVRVNDFTTFIACNKIFSKNFYLYGFLIISVSTYDLFIKIKYMIKIFILMRFYLAFRVYNIIFEKYYF